MASFCIPGVSLLQLRSAQTLLLADLRVAQRVMPNFRRKKGAKQRFSVLRCGKQRTSLYGTRASSIARLRRVANTSRVDAFLALPPNSPARESEVRCSWLGPLAREHNYWRPFYS